MHAVPDWKGDCGRFGSLSDLWGQPFLLWEHALSDSAHHPSLSQLAHPPTPGRRLSILNHLSGRKIERRKKKSKKRYSTRDRKKKRKYAYIYLEKDSRKGKKGNKKGVCRRVIDKLRLDVILTAAATDIYLAFVSLNPYFPHRRRPSNIVVVPWYGYGRVHRARAREGGALELELFVNLEFLP